LLPIATRGEAPLTFQTRNAALEYGCKILPLKEQNIDNAIVWNFDVHDLVINIFDLENDGKLVRKNQLVITSWYQEAKVSFDDLLGNGIQFIKIEFEGNTGTGTLQMITSYWGWKKDRFVPVFLETESYYISSQYLEDFKVDCEVDHKASKQVSLKLNFHYSNNNPKHKSDYSWSESFTWDDSLFSFYNITSEKNKLMKPKNPIQKKIAETRLNLMHQREDINTISVDLLNKIRMMQILYDD
jgi:hypothetical protein